MVLLDVFGFLHLGLIDIFDILMVALIIFLVFRWFRGSSAINIIVAILILLLIRVVVSALGMKMMSALMSAVLDVGVLALIVIFQPEVRRFLYRLGGSTAIARQRRLLSRFFGGGGGSVDEAAVNDITEACAKMSESRTGALIVIRKNDQLDDIVATGDTVDAVVSERIIRNIFFKNSPLHDGAMIIGDDRIVAVRCTLPITDRSDIPASYGMRHKAAVGISERTDATVIVVSEETGDISLVRDGRLTHIDNKYALVHALGGDTQKENA